MENVHNFMHTPRKYLHSFIRSERLRDQGIYCIMCGYNEQENIVKALDSLVGKIDALIFIDKNGALEKIVKTYTSMMEIHYEARPDLNLRESRRYALSKIPAFAWALTVDADELLLLTREDLQKLIVRRVCYRTRMTVLMDGVGVAAMNDYHNFLMYNDGSIYFRKRRDIPRYTGRHVNLDVICKENRSWCKDTRHLLYRTIYWKAWQYSKLRAGPIEDYIKSLGQELPTDEQVAAWYEEFKKNPAAYPSNLP